MTRSATRPQKEELQCLFTRKEASLRSFACALVLEHPQLVDESVLQYLKNAVFDPVDQVKIQAMQTVDASSKSW